MTDPYNTKHKNYTTKYGSRIVMSFKLSTLHHKTFDVYLLMSDSYKPAL